MNGVEITAHVVTEYCLRLRAIFRDRIYRIVKVVPKVDTIGIMYIKNGVLFRPNKVKYCCFTFID